MKDKINLILELLAQLKDQNDLQKIRRLEEKIQSISVDVKKELSENKELENDKELKEKIFLLGDIITSLEKDSTADNKMFIEFQDFLKDRKFK